MRSHIATALILTALIAILVVAVEMSGVRVYNRVATNLCIFLVLVLGLQTFMGNSGILSFAHVGFMGVGAYASAIMTIPSQVRGMALPDLYPVLQAIELSPLLAIPIGGLVAAAIAAIVSYPLMRLSDAAAVITSFALLVVLHTIINNWSEVTNGPRTLFGVPGTTTLWVAAGCAVLAVLAALAFKESRTGKLLRATRDDEIAGTGLGADVTLLRWKAFVLAAFFAGIAGGLWVHFITSFSPQAFYLRETFLVITMLVLGGTGTVTGAVFGALLVTFAYEGLRGLEGVVNASGMVGGQVAGLTEIVLALAMIAVLVLRPGGVFPNREIGNLVMRQWDKRSKAKAPPLPREGAPR